MASPEESEGISENLDDGSLNTPLRRNSGYLKRRVKMTEKTVESIFKVTLIQILPAFFPDISPLKPILISPLPGNEETGFAPQ